MIYHLRLRHMHAEIFLKYDVKPKASTFRPMQCGMGKWFGSWEAGTDRRCSN